MKKNPVTKENKKKFRNSVVTGSDEIKTYQQKNRISVALIKNHRHHSYNRVTFADE